MHSSASAQSFIRSTRPGFPEGLKVLLVMKDTATRTAAKKVLEDVSYQVHLCATLDKALQTVNDYDVALVEAKMVEVLLTPAGGASPTRKKFEEAAKETAFVLMQEDDTGGAKQNVIQAIQMGVVDVVKVPLVKHSMRTLWQHSVRKMMVGQNGAEPSGRMAEVLARSGMGRSSASLMRIDSAPGGMALDAAAAGGSGRGQSISPNTVLEDIAFRNKQSAVYRQQGNEGVAAPASNGGGGGGANKSPGAKDANGTTGTTNSNNNNNNKTGSGGSMDIDGHVDGAKSPSKKSQKVGVGSSASDRRSEDGAIGGQAAEEAKKAGGGGTGFGSVAVGGGVGSGSTKQKSQVRSTQQWKAAEQRGRRLAIKPHTAVPPQPQARMTGQYWQGGQAANGMGQRPMQGGQMMQQQVWAQQPAMGAPVMQQGVVQQPQQGAQQGVVQQAPVNGMMPQQVNGGMVMQVSNGMVAVPAQGMMQQGVVMNGMQQGMVMVHPQQMQMGQQQMQMGQQGMVQQPQQQMGQGQMGQPVQMMQQGQMMVQQGQMMQGQQMPMQQQQQMGQMQNGQQGQIQNGQQGIVQQQQNGGMVQQQQPMGQMGQPQQQGVGQNGMDTNANQGMQQQMPQPMSMGMEQQQQGPLGLIQGLGSVPSLGNLNLNVQDANLEQIKTQPLPLGLTLKRSNSLLNLGSLPNDAVLSDLDLSNMDLGGTLGMEEDALDLMLSHAKDVGTFSGIVDSVESHVLDESLCLVAQTQTAGGQA